jgi:hypothetical protein
MKYIIKESQIKKLLKNKTLNENFLDDIENFIKNTSEKVMDSDFVKKLKDIFLGEPSSTQTKTNNVNSKEGFGDEKTW